MENIPFFLIVRLLLGLIAGIWLARKMRGFLRWLVVHLMPVRYRVSEQSFNMQTRISASLAYLLALGVAALVYTGLGKAWDKASMPRVAKTETAEASSSSLEPTLPSTYSAPVYNAPEEAAPPQENLPAPAPAPPPATMRAPEPPPPARPDVYEESGRYFVQLYAFREEARAWAQKQYWQGRLSQRVWVGVAAGEPVPYKVLAGPFHGRQEARRYLRSNGLAGFPREQKDIRLFED